MKIKKTSTPVLVLCCEIGALGIFRSLGKLGIAVYAVDENTSGAAVSSRYCKQHWTQKLNPQQPELYLEFLLQRAKKIAQKEAAEKIVLIPTSDSLAEFVSTNQQELSAYFVFQYNKPALIQRLISKKGMYYLAQECAIPVPLTLFPQTIDEVKQQAAKITYPVMLKGINGAVLYQRTGIKMLIVNSFDELLAAYNKLEDMNQPNLMIQEYIPGADDQVYIFNAYFNQQSECLQAYTGHKIRQFPVHRGCASLGISTWIEDFAQLNRDFMKKIGYFGILDIGYRLDPRDGLYKVLDINPRLGGAFRLFVSENGMDVVRSLYLDLTGQPQSLSPPIEGRMWMIEDWDFVASYCYMKEGKLSVMQWLRSIKGVSELAWFDWRDPVPFVFRCLENAKKIMTKLIKK